MTQTETTVSNLKINILTKQQYEGITPSDNELYMVIDEALTSSDVTTALGYTPQAQLVSGTNIKTINNESLLGSGNINVSGGGGTATDVQINGTSITSNNVANIVTNTAYDATNNKVATMGDISTKANLNGGNILHGNQTLEDTSSGHIVALPPQLQFKNENGTIGFYLDNSANQVKMSNSFTNELTSNLPFIDGDFHFVYYSSGSSTAGSFSFNLGQVERTVDGVTKTPLNILPEDNYSYLLYVRIEAHKKASGSIYLGNVANPYNNNETSWTVRAGTVTEGGVDVNDGVIPIGTDRILYMQNNGGTSGNFQIRGYRRIGTNS